MNLIQTRNSVTLEKRPNSFVSHTSEYKPKRLSFATAWRTLDAP